MINLEQLKPCGTSLHRPECVLCCESGIVYVSDWRGGVTSIYPDGRQVAIIDDTHGEALKPNGIALLNDGSFLLANLGEAGGVWHLSRAGVATPWLTEVQGQRLPPCNYVMVDAQYRVWITVSTRKQPRKLGYRPWVDDGFIVLVDDHGSRIVADGLGYTNEVQIDPSQQWLYVNETFARRLSRFSLSAGEALGPRETLVEFGEGTFPDGMAFDQQGRLWITSIVSNRLFVVSDGSANLILEDSDRAHIDWVERAFKNGTMDREHLDSIVSKKIKGLSSIAFGGRDLRTLYLGCLLDDKIQTLEQQTVGVKPVHWHWG